MHYTNQLLQDKFKIAPRVLELTEAAEKETAEDFKVLDDIMTYNQYKILDAFQKNRLSDMHFGWNTGYGYDDAGREGLDKVYARIFKAEAALVRPHFVNGTHAIGAAIFGNLRPNDVLLCASGKPYDTLHSLMGTDETKRIGSLFF